ncbi:hypothetical protein GCM10009679_47220 [Saccharothrix algeriensis]|uniref:Ricin B lectin domain-containing protein n=2 Tax=Catellatospora bangladeshensis TaxID=310355 RepID=A0A8J3JPM5_9ACTN|nr:hypothetical protein Cba03nite_59800 [Catellatospora bangladeshensis]
MGGVAVVMTVVAGTAGALVAPSAAFADTLSPPDYLVNTSTGSLCVTNASTAVLLAGCDGGTNQMVRVKRYSGNQVQLQARRSSYTTCLAPEGGSTASGTPIVQVTCGSSTWKLWTVNVDAITHEYQFTNVKSGRSLGWDGTGVFQGGSRIRWLLTPAGTWYRIGPTHTDKCLDVDTAQNNGTYEGVRVQQWTCLPYAQTNQLWAITELEAPFVFKPGPYTGSVLAPAVVRFQPAHYLSSCLTWDNTANGTAVRQRQCSATPTQNRKWLLIPVNHDLDWPVYKIVAYGGEGWPCLDVDNRIDYGVADGTKVQIHQCLDGQANQEWYIYKAAA